VIDSGFSVVSSKCLDRSPYPAQGFREWARAQLEPRKAQVVAVVELVKRKRARRYGYQKGGV
jgi:hypothetical protein